MADNPDPGSDKSKANNAAGAADPTEAVAAMARIAEKSQRLVAGFLERQSAGGGMGMADPMNIGGAFIEMTNRMLSDPAKMIEAQTALWRDYADLWQRTAKRMN